MSEMDFALFRDYAFFANAAYATLPTISDQDLIKSILASEDNGEIPKSLTESILPDENWSVLHHYSTNNSVTGFAATVFEYTRESGQQEIVIAVRGSEDPFWDHFQTDWATTNLSIANSGVAKDQALDLHNYIERLITPEGEATIELSLEVETLMSRRPRNRIVVEGEMSGQGLGILSENTLPISIVGHSLGGHLAVVGKHFFPNLISEAYSFNGALFNPLSESFFEDVNTAFLELGSDKEIDETISSFGVTRINSEDSIPGDDGDVVPGITGWVRPGDEQLLRTEKNSHNIGQILDSLTLHALIQKMNPGITASDLNELFDSLANKAEKSQETFLEQLYELVSGQEFTFSKYVEASWTSAGEFDERTAYYDFYANQLLPELKSRFGENLETISELSLESLADDNKSTIFETSTQETSLGQSTRYALENLLSFGFSGDISATEISSPDYELEHFSDKYLDARSVFLNMYHQMNEQDIDSNVIKASIPVKVEDLRNDIQLSSSSSPRTQRRNEFHFGSEEGDTINGGYYHDQLFGRGGNDTFMASKGSDYLEGGAGNDTYLFDSSYKGNDTIYDEGGDILFNDVLLSGVLVSTNGENFYSLQDSSGNEIAEFEDYKFTLVEKDRTRLGTMVTETDLLINHNDYILTLENFSSGNFNLDVSTDEFSPEVVEHDLEVSDGDTDADGEMDLAWINEAREPAMMANSFLYESADYYEQQLDKRDAEGNFNPDGVADALVNFRFDGGNNNDQMHGVDWHTRLSAGEGLEPFNTYSIVLAEGNSSSEYMAGDILRGRDGDDVIHGDGVDLVAANLSNDADLLIGGTGNDQLFGGGGNDILFGGETENYIHTLQNSVLVPEILENEGDEDYLDGGEGNDYLNGGSYRDTLLGQNGNDQINAGAGSDQISGGDGNDIIHGDSVSKETEGVIGGFYLAYVNQQQTGLTYDDSIQAGKGNDTVYGEIGSDVISAGDGNDHIWGDRWYSAESNFDPLGLNCWASNNPDMPLPDAYQHLNPEFHGNDVLLGGRGEDFLVGQGGNDYIDAGSDNDFVMGDDNLLSGELHGEDEIHGGSGNDMIEGGGGDDLIYGNADNDVIWGDRSQSLQEGLSVASEGFVNVLLNAGSDQQGSYGDHGNDTIYGGQGIDKVYGGNGDDQIFGGTEDDELWGDSWNNSNESGTGADVVDGGEGDDLIIAGAGDDLVFGGSGNDSIWGDRLEESTFGGNDTIHGGSGEDTIVAGLGLDVISGDDGIDVIWGNEDKDTLFGGDGDDRLFGDGSDYETEDDNDLLNGGNGNDSLTGGGGRDTLHGGSGNDVLLGDYLDSDDGKGDTLYGEAGDDTLDGGVGGDRLYGGDGNDVVFGGKSNDILRGDAGDDTLLGENGHDVIIGGDGNDQISGGNGNDNLRGYAGNDLLIGEAGHDTLYGHRGHDQLQGGDGDDWLEDSMGDDRLDGGSGNDYLSGGVDNDLLIGGTGDDELWGGSGDETIWGDNGDNSGTGNDTIFGEAGEDTVYGGDGLDYIDGGADNDVINGQNGDDVVHGSEGDDMLWGADGGDILYGGEGEDYIDGGNGNDTLSSGSGNDSLQGGPGSDTYIFKSGDGVDVLSMYHFDFDDTETLIFEDINSISELGLSNGKIVYGTGDEVYTGIDLQAEQYLLDSLNIVIGGGGQTQDVSEVLKNRARSKTVASVLTGSHFDDVLVGSDFDDTISGLAGNDEIIGLAGDDYLNAGEGIDKVLAGRGIDVVYGGAGDDEIYGEEGSDLLFGNEGHDFIHGGLDNARDTLYGGKGNDVLSGGANQDEYHFSLGDGRDEIIGDNPYDADRIVFDATVNPEWVSVNAIPDAYGNSRYVLNYGAELDDRIILESNGYTLQFADGKTIGAHLVQQGYLNWGNIGASGDQTFTGTARKDYVVTSTANDFLQGLAGNDTLFGGGGTDTLLGGDGNDHLKLSAGEFSSAHGDDGDDYLESFGDHAVLYGGLGDDVLEMQLGATFNTLYGGDGNDVLHDNGDWNSSLIGGQGDDQLYQLFARSAVYGGEGNDVYYLSQTDVWYSVFNLHESANEGNDTIVFDTLYGSANGFGEYINYQLDENFENLIDQRNFIKKSSKGKGDLLIGNSADNEITGNDRWNFLQTYQTLRGEAGNDILSAAYLLEGGEGDDILSNGFTLNGGSGADVMSDAKVAYVDNPLDQTHNIESVISSIDFSLNDSAQNLTLIGNAVNGVGNAQDNIFVGNELDNTFVGGAGNDTYFLQEGDSFIELSDQGDDTVFADSVDLNDSFYLNIENAGLIENSDGQLLGNAGNNVLTGNSLSNTIISGAGNDSLLGAAGNDYLVSQQGNNWLSGGVGNDSYFIAKTDAKINIDDQGNGYDEIVFAPEITQQDFAEANKQYHFSEIFDHNINEWVTTEQYTIEFEWGQQLVLNNTGSYVGDIESLYFQHNSHRQSFEHTAIEPSVLPDNFKLAVADVYSLDAELLLSNDAAGLQIHEVYGAVGGEVSFDRELNRIYFYNDVTAKDYRSWNDNFLYSVKDSEGNVFSLPTAKVQFNGLYHDYAPVVVTDNIVTKRGNTLAIGMLNDTAYNDELYVLQAEQLLQNDSAIHNWDIAVMDVRSNPDNNDSYAALENFMGIDFILYKAGAQADLSGTDYFDYQVSNDITDPEALNAWGRVNISLGGIAGESGAVIIGGQHDDLIETAGEQDTWNGSSGNDYIHLAVGQGDTVVFDVAQGGHDVINPKALGDLSIRELELHLKGVNSLHDLDFSYQEMDLLINFKNSAENSISILGYAENENHQFDTICFLDGSTGECVFQVSREELNSHLASADGSDNIIKLLDITSINGLEGDDEILGHAMLSDTLFGGAGNDLLRGNSFGHDTLDGGSGNDHLIGNTMDDLLIGGIGDDLLSGDDGDDTYIFKRGDGKDVIRNNESKWLENHDQLIIDQYAKEELFLSSSNDLQDLHINFDGTDDQIIIEDYFVSDSEKIDQIVLADSYLDDTGILKLVEVMASINQPDMPGEVVTAETHDKLESFLAETWQQAA